MEKKNTEGGAWKGESVEKRWTGTKRSKQERDVFEEQTTCLGESRRSRGVTAEAVPAPAGPYLTGE